VSLILAIYEIYVRPLKGGVNKHIVKYGGVKNMP
jgi:hypothetical protein